MSTSATLVLIRRRNAHFSKKALAADLGRSVVQKVLGTTIARGRLSGLPVSSRASLRKPLDAVCQGDIAAGDRERPRRFSYSRPSSQLPQPFSATALHDLPQTWDYT